MPKTRMRDVAVLLPGISGSVYRGMASIRVLFQGEGSPRPLHPRFAKP